MIVNFSHESDVTSLDPFLFYYCVPHKIRRGILLTTNADIRHLLDSLVSALAVYAIAFRSRLSLVLAPTRMAKDCFEDVRLCVVIIVTLCVIVQTSMGNATINIIIIFAIAAATRSGIFQGREEG